ncbi:hypothetical protein ILP74_06105 [Citrobacter amalonaticus]|nr:hypothetical protein [Citrobacter amalonaticus]MBE0395052.1 hypothetical protein [Citrobacter amalonaticus]
MSNKIFTLSGDLFDKPETRRLIDSCITESIRLHCRPGGIIWQTLRR